MIIFLKTNPKKKLSFDNKQETFRLFIIKNSYQLLQDRIFVIIAIVNLIALVKQEEENHLEN